MPPSVRIYRYLASQWALKSLRERRLRVSRINELNDPLEWRVGSIGEHPGHVLAGRESFDAFVDRLNEEMGVISHSATSADPVIWSHYADSHKGIALEFDHLIGEYLHPVSYSHSLPIFDVSQFLKGGSSQDYTLTILRNALDRKSLSWAYEKEYRVHFALATNCEKEGDDYFKRIPQNYLKRVILGVRCATTVQDVKEALAEGGLSDVEVVKARLSETTYEILCD